MNKEEGEKVIKILLECDGGCEYCAAYLLKLFCNEFPDHMQPARKAFQERFGKEPNYFTSEN